MSEKRYEPHRGHRARMRKRLKADPRLKGFADHELLEVMLYGSYRRENTNVKAHMLLDHFGSLKNVLSASPKELVETGIIGEKSALLLAELGSIRFSHLKHLRKRFEELQPEPIEFVFSENDDVPEIEEPSE
ncbi:MAG: hypothetical protein IJ746_02090 [Ruminococcus sp.]|nr:hypothetical protein [Ruminococcus sp.]